MIGDMARGALVLHLLLALFLTLQSTPASADPKVCVVFSKDQTSALSALITGLTSNFQILYVFEAINGIALKIDGGLLPVLEKLPGVLAVIPDRLHNVHTTHSWEFLGLESGGKSTYEWEDATKKGERVIIANVDSGVSPTSQSFWNDDVVGFPDKWLGTCQAQSNLTFGCNKKLIGAKLFNTGMKESNLVVDQTDLNSPWDYVGHGLHTLSTAGGGFVERASVLATLARVRWN